MKKIRVDVKPVPKLDVQLGLLLAMLDGGTKEWRSELGKISPQVLTWQAFTDGHSIGAEILHIADVEAFWIQEVAYRQPLSEAELKTLLSKETQQDSFHWPKPPKKSLNWYFEQHNRIRKRTHKIVRELADPVYLAYRDKKTSRHEFTLRWLLHHVITHEAYHSGQAVLLAIQHQQGKRKEKQQK
jgi:uncharacterized damage-inducible protein DinB